MKKKLLYLNVLVFFLCVIFSFRNKEVVESYMSEQNACTQITQSVVYYSANIFNYNYVGFNAAARNMTQAQYNALSDSQKLALDQTLALTGPSGSDTRALQYTGIGLVKNKAGNCLEKGGW